ncbi:MAG: DUF927 domain-containing protein [Agitococcus sp.]|nr:DUF927 domain-containing protein [Agitococcus sp.]
MTIDNTELVRSALTFIPANDRELWLKIGNALKTELGDTGFSVWTDWSETADTYQMSDAKAVWQSLQIGKNKLGSVFYYAKKHGFTYDKNHKPQLISPQQRAEREQQQQADISQAEQEKALRYERTAFTAQGLWQGCHYINDSHPYLQNKGVKAFNLRCYSGDLVISGMACQDCLVIPVTDNTGKIYTLQFIRPTGEKRFLPNGNKQGHYYLIAGNSECILVCEGYATGASLHQATGYSVAVAFDASNLLAVSLALRTAYPTTPLIICADNDHEKPKNTGLEAAHKAALAVNGVVSYPIFTGTGEGLKDFNDLARTEGLTTVNTTIEQARPPEKEKTVLPTTESTALRIDAPSIAEPATSESVSQTAIDTVNAALEKAATTEATETKGTYFYLDDANTVTTRRGVYYVGLDKEGNQRNPQHICGVLKILALTRNADHRGHGYLLEWLDRDNHKHRWAMPAEMFKGDGSEVRGYLMSGGLFISPNQSARTLLAQYIQTQHTNDRVLCVEKTGWQEHEKDLVYVTPDQTYGKHANTVVYQSESHTPHGYKQKGTLEAWRKHIAALCVGNSRLVFSVCTAFAGTLLKLIGDESGGFHLRGDSSLGKSTAQHAACSVWGNRDYKQSWRATINGLEATAAMYNDGLLVLDEIGQAEAKDIGETVYMLANGQGKSRASKSVMPRKILTWGLLFLSSGEMSLSQHMLSGGRKIRAGQELRLVDIPADTESGNGLLEHLHQFTTGKDLVEHLNQHTLDQYGTAGHAFLMAITPQAHQLGEQLKTLRQAFMAEIVPDGAGSQVLRVASRFALVAIAGELASQYSITGWSQGEAKQAVKICFEAWLKARGSVANMEKEYLLRQVKAFLEQFGESRFSDLCLKADTTVRTTNRVGYREPDSDGILFYCLPEAFKEIITGYDTEFAIKVLREAGWLKTGEGKHAQMRKRLPEGNIRIYALLGSRIFDGD